MRPKRPMARMLAAVIVASPLWAAEPPTPQPTSPEQQAAMQAYLKAMAPGPEHRWLAAAVGSWTFHGKFWDGAGGAPTESSGTAERSLALGGRILVEKVVSEVMGMPFEGLGMTGYDNVSGQFWSTWNDNLSTGVMISTGNCDLAAGGCRFAGSYSDPITGKVKSNRMETTRVSPDEEVSRAWETGADGAERLTMELTYTRRKE